MQNFLFLEFYFSVRQVDDDINYSDLTTIRIIDKDLVLTRTIHNGTEIHPQPTK